MSTMSNPTTVTPDTATTTATGDSSGLLASDIVAPRVDDIVKQSMSPDSSCDSPSAMPVASTSALGTGGNQLSLLFSVPELSPTVGAELSPNDPLISTPIGAHPLWSTDFHRKQMGGHNVMDPSGVYRAMIDPVQVLKTCDLPDLSNGLPESVLHQMWALIGGLSVDDSTEFGALNLATDHGSKTHTGSYSIGKTSATTGTKRKPENTPQHIDGTLPPPSNRVPQALVHVAQRYRLHEPASTLLAMLRQSLVDADVNMKVRQFWVTLESGNASDFVLLAHLTVAAREAQLSSKINLRHPQHLLETTCFEAARSEWDAGRVEASTGEVYGLLMLSEYGYQTGRNAILWEFAHNALDTARRIVFRNTRYPWHGARLTRLPDEASCDVEYEHILTCYWSAWVRLLTAAQTTRRRLGPQLYTLRSDDDSAGTLMLPEFTAHDMCHFTAQPVVRPGKTVPSAVEFPPMACRHKPHFAYSASLLQCSLMVAEMHDRHIDLLDRQIGPVAFLDALRLWDHRMCRWRACWPPEWEAQMAEMFETAHRINSSKYDNIVPLDPSPIRLYRPVNRRIQSGLSLSDAANNTATVSASGLMHTGSHLFHRSQMTPADSWLTILAALCETARLRMHRIALALLRHRRPQSTIDYHSQSGATVPRQLPLAAVASQFDEPLTRLSESVLTADGDIMYDEMEFHRYWEDC
ncbi:hypothetical protein H4R24_002548 [Coemansia sp. RSA 988]|nr:hypothetical protein H4R24_002548 [Coemansia sp. RSA 988]